MFETAVAEARRTHWFAEGEVPDSVEGRFAVLATVVALILVRLEQDDSSQPTAAALTERFIEAMDAEIRQMGVGDPALGRQVRALVGALATRVERWREAVADPNFWAGATRRSLHRDRDVGESAAAHGESAARRLWERLAGTGIDALAEGRLE